MIKTIFFDIGNVLLTIHPEIVVHELSRTAAVSEQRVEEVLSGGIHDAYERGELADSEFYFGVLEKLSPKRRLTQDQFFSCWRGMLGEVTDTLTYALSLSDSMAVWLSSNTNRHHIHEGGVGHLLEGFKGAIYSSDVGFRKPDERFFQEMLRIATASVSESLFIDDREENVIAAASLGIRVIQYRSHAQFLEEMKNIEIIS